MIRSALDVTDMQELMTSGRAPAAGDHDWTSEWSSGQRGGQTDNDELAGQVDRFPFYTRDLI